MCEFDKTNGQTVILAHLLMLSSGEYWLACALIKVLVICSSTIIHTGDMLATYHDNYCTVIKLVCNNRDT